MENKLQELTRKLYNEGVEKANKEAEKIIDEARQEADKIKSEAEKEAEKIVGDAEKKSKELKRNVENELQQAFKQTTRNVKQQITELIVSKVIEEPVKESFKDNKFVMKLIETAITNWTQKGGDMSNLAVILPKDLVKDFEKYFKGKTGKELNAKLEVKVSDSMKGGFAIGPADDSYKINFSEKDFENYFKNYLRPKTMDLLFEEK